jgi:2-hydroxycyclohexanecarboxyl-CoA dehydrogenase
MQQDSQGLVVVAGGAGGIGSAITRAVKAEGYGVLVLDANEAKLSAICTAESGIDGVVLDAKDLGAVTDAVADAVAKHGPLRGLVSTIGWNEHGWFADQDPEYWQKLYEINLLGPMVLSKVALQQFMSEGGGGRIVLFSSDAARVGTMQEAAYSAMKGGIVSLTKSLAREGAKFGVTANCICPGPTDTPLLRSSTEGNEAILERMVRGIPLKRIGQPVDYAGIVGCLIAEGGGYITGQVISVSGGLTMAG